MQDNSLAALVAIAKAAYPAAPEQPLTTRQACRIIMQLRNLPTGNGQRRAVLAAIVAVQKHTAIMQDDALDVAELQLPLGYNITPQQAFAWQQLLVAAF